MFQCVVCVYVCIHVCSVALAGPKGLEEDTLREALLILETKVNDFLNPLPFSVVIHILFSVLFSLFQIFFFLTPTYNLYPLLLSLTHTHTHARTHTHTHTHTHSVSKAWQGQWPQKTLWV